MALLEIQNLSINFGAFQAVKDACLSVDKGQFVALLGPSGCGKTSLALSILQLQRGVDIWGKIIYKGANLLTLPQSILNTVRGADIAMIFQEPMTSLNPVQRVGKQIMESLMLHAEKPTKKRVLELMSMVDLPKRLIDSYPHQLSGGQRQRIMIAMALAGNPKVLIADEPTTALDMVTQQQILDLLKNLQRQLGLAILFITHDVEIVQNLADKFYVMENGQIISEQVPVIPRLSSPIPLEPCAKRVLEVKHLTIKYGQLTVVKDFELSLHEGETVGLVGQSGCGKSSVGFAVTRLIDASGQVWLDGVDFFKLKGSALKKNRSKIQMVFQDPFGSLNARMTIKDIISEGLKIHHQKNIDQRVLQMIQQVQLSEDILNRYPHELSGGQRVRVALARALVMNPKVLVLDEITTALDIQTQRVVVELLKNVQRTTKIAYLFISHDRRILQSIAHRTIEMLSIVA